MLIVFDLLADTDGKTLLAVSLDERRAKLKAFAGKYFRKSGSLRLSPATTKPAEAKKWFKRVGPVLDGIIANRRDLSYRSGSATACRRSRTIAVTTA